MKVLITGGAGFIGSHTAHRLLEQGHSVRILDNLDPQIHGEGGGWPVYLDPRIDRRFGDVRDVDTVRNAVGNVDAVYHFAALTGVGQSMYDFRSYADVAVVGTANLLEVLVKRSQRLHRLVLASSRAVYGEGTGYCPKHGAEFPEMRRREELDRGDFDQKCSMCNTPLMPKATSEDRPLKPTSVYGWSKQQQEFLCRYVGETHRLPVVILRYFNVYGPHQSLKNPYTGVATVFFSRIKADKDVFVYEFNKPLRDMVYIDDVVSANILALNTNVPWGSIYNVGSGTACTVADIARTLGKAVGKEPDLRTTGEFRVGDILQCYADLGRVRAALGYRPRVSLEEGMRGFVRWAMDQETKDLYQRTVDELQALDLFGRAEEGDEG